MDLQEAIKKQNENMGDQLKSRYTDDEIKQTIQYASSVNDPMWALTQAQLALAMIHYNEMISRRWR